MNTGNNIVLVIGAGQMGSGIAQVTAGAGYNVVLNDVSADIVNSGIVRIEKSLSSQVQKGKIRADEMQKIISRIHCSTSFDDAAAAELVIEAVFEEYDLKTKIFSALDKICPAETIFATNTSAIQITYLAASVKRSERFIGLHFFNPPQVLRLVEVIPGLKTSRTTIDCACRFLEKIKMETVIVKDVPGFLVNRINAALRLEAYNCLLEGVASLEDIDKALKIGLGHPMGPFELAGPVFFWRNWC